MNLQDSLSVVEATTSALLAAIGAGDEAVCGGLLERRREALDNLAAALDGAEARERSRLAPRLDALVAADRELQQAAAEALSRAAAADRSRFGQDGRALSSSEREPQNACLDRRA